MKSTHGDEKKCLPLGPTNEGVHVLVVDESVGTEDTTVQPLPDEWRRQLEAKRRPLPPRSEESKGEK